MPKKVCSDIGDNLERTDRQQRFYSQCELYPESKEETLGGFVNTMEFSPELKW